MIHITDYDGVFLDSEILHLIFKRYQIKKCMGKTTLKRGVNESNRNNTIYKELWSMFILILTELKKINKPY